MEVDGDQAVHTRRMRSAQAMALDPCSEQRAGSGAASARGEFGRGGHTSPWKSTGIQPSRLPPTPRAAVMIPSGIRAWSAPISGRTPAERQRLLSLCRCASLGHDRYMT